MSWRRLDRDAAGVEGHALADEGDRRVARPCRRSTQHQQLRGSRTEPWATPSSAPMPSLAISLSPSTSKLEAEAFDARADALDEGFGIDDVGRLGDQFAGQRHAFDDRRIAAGRSALRRLGARRQS